MNTTNDQEIPKTYNAQDWEEKLYALWEKSGFFNPDECIKAGITDETKPIFSIVLPPPNVTGTLHTGSACMLAIEDLIVRYHRMKGDRTLWLPGTDHAAIATQSKVEKIIYKEEGKTRHDLGREEFLKRVERFAKNSHDTIIHQTKKLGASLDWSREAYTLDDKRNLAVRITFKKMYDDGLIYRGYRVVNWTVQGQSTCSDDEVVTIERQAKLYTFKYSKNFPIAVATTRPETKLGDTAVAVHPEDKRYKKYIGQTFVVEVGAKVPLEIKIIGDESVDPLFGTGAVGITPAHSHADFEMREKHPGIALVQIIGQDGKMTEDAGAEYAGLTILEAREKFVTFLRENNLLEKEVDVIQNVGTSDRYEDVLEVIPMNQWFVAVNKEFGRDGGKTTLKTLMREAVTSGRITILPDRFTKTYFHWIDNLRDWCISRQIWFGHRIPVWYCRAHDKEQCQLDCKNPIVSVETPLHCPVCGSADLVQDPDTLDTWFSSGLWTFSTLGWPDTDAKDFKTYHPTTLLETGYDILFFWVARMILMTEYLLHTHPFNTVYLHGLVRDEQGRKMSKSLGNVIDPLTVSEKYGADALRLALVLGNTPGNDLALSDDKIVAMRNFTNKLWNIGRYVNNAGYKIHNARCEKKPELQSSADHWIITRLQEVNDEVTRLLENYQPSLAGEKLRDFTWNEFADWYVEIHKIEKNDRVLGYVFEILLKLWHPFMPFVTEAIYQTFHPDAKKFLMTESWPETIDAEIKSDEASRFQSVIGLIQEIRALRSFYKIDPAKYMAVTVKEGANEWVLSRDNGAIFQRLARVSNVHTIKLISAAPQKSVRVSFGLLDAYIELEGVIDFDIERKRLEKEKTEKTAYINTLETKLENQKFLERAKPDVVQAEQMKLENARQQLSDLDNHLASLG